MQELELTWSRVLRFWWAFFWRGVVITIPIAIALGMISGMVIAVTGMPNFTASPLFLLAEMVILLPISPMVLRMAMRAAYPDFRVVLVPPPASV